MFEHGNQRRTVLKGLAASAALSLAGVRAGHGQPKETQDKVTEAAKQEGGFLWYDHFGREEGQGSRIAGKTTAPEGHLRSREDDRRKPLTQRGFRYHKSVFGCLPCSFTDLLSCVVDALS